MPRLIDDIRSIGKVTKPFCVARNKIDIWARHALALSKILDDDLPVIKIDNVAEYFYSGTDQEYWDLTQHFPNLAPPFELAWFEHKMPKVIKSSECGETKIGELMPHGRIGVLLMAGEAGNFKGEGIPEGTRWGVALEMFIDYDDDTGGIQAPHGTIFLAIDAEGRLLHTPSMQTFCAPGQEEMMKSFISWANPTLLAISFMHCKNVKTIDEQVPKPLAKKYHAKTGKWPVRYKTIEIRPLKEILRREGRSDSQGLQKALHICRGHFRDYREGPGLFGKYHQLVWTPATVRGTTKKEKEKPKAREYEVKL